MKKMTSTLKDGRAIIGLAGTVTGTTIKDGRAIIRLGEYSGGSPEDTNAYSAIQRLVAYAYNAAYDDLISEDEAEAFLAEHYGPAPAGACTSVVKDGFGIHNFDWYKTHLAGFRIVVPRKEATGSIVRYASQGMGGNGKGLTDDFVRSGAYSERFKYLPYTIVDGINENGVFATINVVSSIDGVPTSGTNPGKPNLNALRVVRYVLDHFASAEEAVAALRDECNIYTPHSEALAEEFHYIIADEEKIFLVELVGNACVVTDKTADGKAYITNFRLEGVTFDGEGKVVPSSVEPHGQGVERYDTVTENIDKLPVTAENCFSLCRLLKFTQAYTESTPDDVDLPLLKTEFTGIYQGGAEDLTVTSPAEDFRRVWGIARQMYADPAVRDNGNTWHTMHSAVYDLAARKLYLCVQEDFDTVFEFAISDRPLPEPEPERATASALKFSVVEASENIYIALDNIQPESNKKIVTGGTPLHLLGVVATEAVRTRFAAVLQSGKSRQGDVSEELAILPVVSVVREGADCLIAGFLTVADEIVSALIEYRGGQFYRGVIQMSDSPLGEAVIYNHRQYLSPDEENTARRNIGSYGIDHRELRYFFEWDGSTEGREQVKDNAGNIFTRITVELPWEGEFLNGATIIIDGSGWDGKPGAEKGYEYISLDGTTIPFLFIYDAAVGSVNTSTDGSSFAEFTGNGVWFKIPASVDVARDEEIIIPVPQEFLPDVPTREEVRKETEALSRGLDSVIQGMSALSQTVGSQGEEVERIGEDLGEAGKQISGLSDALARETTRAQEAEDGIKSSLTGFEQLGNKVNTLFGNESDEVRFPCTKAVADFIKGSVLDRRTSMSSSVVLNCPGYAITTLCETKTFSSAFEIGEPTSAAPAVQGIPCRIILSCVNQASVTLRIIPGVNTDIYAEQREWTMAPGDIYVIDYIFVDDPAEGAKRKCVIKISTLRLIQAEA